MGVRACYDEAKRYGEAYLTSAVRARGIDGVIARIFNTYGPRMRVQDGRVIPNFALAALRGAPLTVYGDGKQTRSFCYVSDLVEAVVRLARREAVAGKVINIGNPDEVTIAELARVICEVANVPLRISEAGLPPDDPTRRKPVIDTARALLGWEPKVALRDGVTATLDYFREERKPHRSVSEALAPLIQPVENVTLACLIALFIGTQVLYTLAFIVDMYFLALPVDWVDMSEQITEPESEWPYIVLFYPVLRELEATMRTTLLSLTKVEYPADRCRVVAIPNSNDIETIASLRRYGTEFPFLEMLEVPPTSDPSWQIVWDAWEANPKAYWWHHGPPRRR